MSASGVRARVRAEMTEEIKAVAKRHLVTDGANLSLRAVARDMGMASSAVYRYFASRDELLTALIIDAYNAVGDAAERAAAAEKGDLDRFLGATHAVRDWALANPHEWALIYGSPVPGYEAPQDTIGPATRVILLIAAIVRDAYLAGRVAEREPITGGFAEELGRVAEQYTPGAPPRLVAAAMSSFLHLGGAISAELFGQLKNSVDEDRRGFFDYQMRGEADRIGLT
ncbi:TetR/AcrR family transcriptional regulator [Paractinoplanes atraurantiacus]|uniref:DNA-binding transcriptional regulator, AcrR family n=1 Tax=Paractinoplanes atraurantiacus TaxID=1036182 RepID=A0A285IW11_9ACTN|nr:TetR/AcrR family transcriptional regulator [Actinoplanes atraurantiacus]SNY52128.1 DNA-binding transcriptional regulator, AcrR family [Actinoplanes atraurantiacus]